MACTFDGAVFRAFQQALGYHRRELEAERVKIEVLTAAGSNTNTRVVARAAASFWNFDFARCAGLAGVDKFRWIACTLLAFVVAAADAAMLALILPLGNYGAGGMNSFWHSRAVASVVTHPPSGVAAFLWLAGLMFILAVVKNLFAQAHHMMVGRICCGAVENLGNRMFERYLGFGKAWYDRASHGHTTAVMESRHEVSRIFEALLRLTSNSMLLGGYVCVMLLVSWRLTLIGVLLFPLINLVTRSILDRTAAAAGKSTEAIMRLSRQIYEVLAAIPLFQSAGREKQAFAAFSLAAAQLREACMRSLFLQGISARMQELAGLAALLCMLAVALWTQGAGALQPVTLFIFFFVARLCLPMLASFPELILDVATRLPRAKQMLAVFDGEDKFPIHSGNREFDGLKQGIEFRDLTFSYPDGPQVLREVSFEIRRGSLTALVGPSGSGKSTIVNLLMRFYELPPGMVWIDGHDIRDYAIPSLRRAFSIVSQDSVLLSETLRFNLLFGLDREVSPSELDAVIEEARLQDVVSMLPGGLDGDLGERGARLSGGQKQRVAIARALLRRSSFLILDEATSGLDAITEKLVQEAIGNALRHSTALIIAHRFTTIQLAGHVVVLNEGRVVQQGPLADIASSDGLFREMSEKQVFA